MSPETVANLQWPLNSFLVSHKHRVIYTPIAKNASTSLKNLFVRLSGAPHSEAILTQNVHDYLVSNKTGLSLCDYSSLEAADILADDRYFKFVVLRNPLHRAVSGYLEKFVLHPRPIAANKDRPIVIGSAIDWVYRKRGEEPDYDRSITFEEFANYLALNEDNQLDTHFKSQESYFGNLQFDFVGVMEKMDRLVEVLRSKVRVEFDLEHVNRVVSKKPLIARRGLEDKLPAQLRTLQKLPHHKELLVGDIQRKLERRFGFINELWKKSLY